MNQDDVIEIAKGFSEKLNDAEVELVSRYPTRIASLLAIKERASKEADREYNNDQTFPGDAYRHILWSYQLTREFGAEFAELVTNAHEEGEEASQGKDRAKDLNNNKVGRDWAKQGIPEHHLKERVQTDPQVIRQLKQTESKEKADYSLK
jgi:hypothetical protein